MDNSDSIVTNFQIILQIGILYSESEPLESKQHGFTSYFITSYFYKVLSLLPQKNI